MDEGKVMNERLYQVGWRMDCPAYLEAHVGGNCGTSGGKKGKGGQELQGMGIVAIMDGWNGWRVG